MMYLYDSSLLQLSGAVRIKPVWLVEELEFVSDSNKASAMALEKAVVISCLCHKYRVLSYISSSLLMISPNYIPVFK